MKKYLFIIHQFNLEYLLIRANLSYSKIQKYVYVKYFKIGSLYLRLNYVLLLSLSRFIQLYLLHILLSSLLFLHPNLHLLIIMESFLQIYIYYFVNFLLESILIAYHFISIYFIYIIQFLLFISQLILFLILSILLNCYFTPFSLSHYLLSFFIALLPSYLFFSISDFNQYFIYSNSISSSFAFFIIKLFSFLQQFFKNFLFANMLMNSISIFFIFILMYLIILD